MTQIEALVEFFRWAMREGPWDGGDLDGGSVQDKAESLGLIVKTQYDAEKHGVQSDFERGDDWFEYAPGLLGLAQAPPEFWLLAGRIAGAELNLRNNYQQLGAGHPETIKAWNKLRDAGNAIRQIEDHVWDAALSVPSTDEKSPILNWKLDRPECPRCRGHGRVGIMACNDCGATGVVVSSTNQGGGK